MHPISLGLFSFLFGIVLPLWEAWIEEILLFLHTNKRFEVKKEFPKYIFCIKKRLFGLFIENSKKFLNI
jgi:hypothetical protein